MNRKRRTKNPLETCSFCGAKSAALLSKNQTFGQGRKMIVIESVPTFVCSNCDS